jgi:hypothetical protein
MNTPEIEPLLTQAIREAVDETDLRGLDYLTEQQAARYAGVSQSQFRKRAATESIMPSKFMGKIIYRKTDIQRAIENKWQRSEFAANIARSTGKTRKAATASASAEQM